ncbi:Ring finger protein 26, partial [Stegodyphus mimosarum]
MLFYEGLLLCCNSMLTWLKYAACSVFHHICVFQLQWFNALLSIPAQAYVGLFMLSVLFYFYKSIKPFLQSYFILLAAFGLHLFQKMYYCIFIIFTYFSRIALKIKAMYGIFIPQRNVQDSEIFQQASTSHALNCQPKRLSAFYKYISRRNLKLKIPFYKTDDEYVDQQLEYLKRELSAEKEKHLCVVCHDSEKNVILFPCRHMCMCESCTLALQSSFQGCPLCRRQILSVSQ